MTFWKVFKSWGIKKELRFSFGSLLCATIYVDLVWVLVPTTVSGKSQRNVVYIYCNCIKVMLIEHSTTLLFIALLHAYLMLLCVWIVADKTFSSYLSISCPQLSLELHRCSLSLSMSRSLTVAACINQTVWKWLVSQIDIRYWRLQKNHLTQALFHSVYGFQLFIVNWGTCAL